MHQNLAVILRQFCNGKISFIVLFPGANSIKHFPPQTGRPAGLVGMCLQKTVSIVSSLFMIRARAFWGRTGRTKCL